MKEIIVSGFGGQGVLSLGLFLSYSAMNMNFNTSWLPSYGPEMRGGTANVGVVYSGGEIACPLVTNPDVLVAFNEPSLAKFETSVKENGCIFVNSSIVKSRRKCVLRARRRAGERNKSAWRKHNNVGRNADRLGFFDGRSRASGGETGVQVETQSHRAESALSARGNGLRKRRKQ